MQRFLIRQKSSLSLLAIVFTATTFYFGTASSATPFLVDDTFEHTTQASTGQTTGVWLIRFHSPASSPPPTTNLPEEEFDHLAEELLEHQIFVANVDIDSNPSLAQRFVAPLSPTTTTQTTTTPLYILFRSQRMFVKKHTATKEELRDWVLKFWIQDLGRVVPPPRSTSPVAVAIEDAVAALRAVYTTGRQRFRALVHTATKSTVFEERIEAQAKLALPVLICCLLMLVMMVVRAPKRKESNGSELKGIKRE